MTPETGADLFSAADAITLGIAAVGAVTGIAALAITVFQYYLMGPRIAVEVSAARLGPSSRLVGGDSWSSADTDTLAAHPTLGVAVHAINRGRMPTSIANWAVEVGGGMLFRSVDVPGGNPDLPTRIEAGERLTFIADLSSVIAAIRVAGQAPGQDHALVYGSITTADGRAYRSGTGLRIPLNSPSRS